MGRPKGFVAGAGINDAEYDVDKCPYYNTWRRMLSRCYSAKKQNCYSGVLVCKSWLTFSNFKKWMEAQDWKGKELDKDIIINGNKTYSPDACCFALSSVNSFVIGGSRADDALPIGVKLEKRTGKFTAQVRHHFTGMAEHIGTFSNPDDAYSAWRKRKHELACQLADEQTDQRVAQALRSRYL